MIKYLLLAGILIQLCACMRLDSNAFNANVDKITEYKLEAYEGEVDVELDDSYDIPDSLIHLMSLESELDGGTIYAVYIGDTAKIASDSIIMYCHGNYNHMDFYWPRAKLLANIQAKNHYGVMMVDYHGYGLSEGNPSEDALYADVNTTLTWLKSKGLTSNRLFMYGFSLGSAPATKLTANPQSLIPQKLMLEAPFASADVMVQNAVLINLPASYLVNLELNNAEEIKKVQQDFLWLHGENDDFLNIDKHGAIVAQNYKGSYQESYRIVGGEHSTVPQEMGLTVYLETLAKFIRH